MACCALNPLPTSVEACHPRTPPPPAQALEAVKLLSGVGDPLSRRLLVVDCAAGRFHSVKLRAR